MEMLSRILEHKKKYLCAAVFAIGGIYLFFRCAKFQRKNKKIIKPINQDKKKLQLNTPLLGQWQEMSVNGFDQTEKIFIRNKRELSQKITSMKKDGLK